MVTANLAGGARQEEADPCKYELLAHLLSRADLIGLQEATRVYDASGALVRDDVEKLRAAGLLPAYESYFFAELDSAVQSHPDKWQRQTAARALRDLFLQGCRILQGVAILVRRPHCMYDLWRDERAAGAVGQIIPWYAQVAPYAAGLGERPCVYLGGRDTEPRPLIVARVRARNRFVLFCCTHLSALKEEDQVIDGKPTRAATPAGTAIRKHQVEWIVHYVQSYLQAPGCPDPRVPIVLVGDLNADATAIELGGLERLGLEPVPFDPHQQAPAHATSWPCTHRKRGVAVDLICATKSLIDRPASIHVLDDHEAGPSGGRRISDHYPVEATLRLA